ncbi:MAG: hypothetical protein ABI716_02770 [Candidatus Saccharibacteria bacterium]
MWEALKTPSHGEISVRRILNYVLATIVAAFLWVIFTAPLTHAADANWNGASITYQSHSSIGPANPATVKQLGLLDKTSAYSFVDPVPAGIGTSTSSSTRYLHVIYFAPDVSSSTATNAKYRTYVYQGPSSFSDPTNPVDITLTAQSASTAKRPSSCDIDNGLGWIICPITNTLAAGMDWVFNILSGFLAVRPTETGNDSALFRAWSYMRSFANIAFVAAFLIIIYSQLTNIGITNYSIKKLLPRLIIAAILVNLSYYICSIAIDLSNILGYSLQDVFIQIRNSLVGSGGNSWDLMSWQSLSGFILSGGTAATVGGIALFSTLSTYGVVGSIILLLPALVIGLTGVLVALLIMAARQAIITLLVILAPLAFVAYLLPNTEKWFEKWRSTFMTMLILFPAFSVVFGGSQLAATAIIQNADSINLVILGLLVQVAPLLITPLLIKLSGSMLGRIAGVINNPNKGVIDRTRNWSKERADDRKAQRLSETAKRSQFLRRNGQRVDHNRRKREGTRAMHTLKADARWAHTRDFSDLDQETRQATENKQLGESQSELRYTRSKLTNTEVRQLDINVRQVKLDVENAQLDAGIQNWENNLTTPVVTAKLRQRVLKDDEAAIQKGQDADYDELKGGSMPASLAHTPGIISHANLARDALRRTRVATDRLANAQTVQQQNYVNLLQDNAAIALEAGGIRGEQGRLSVLASAKKASSKFLIDDIQNIQDTMDYDLATNNDELLHMFDASTTQSQRIAYARTMSKNGGPGINALRTAIQNYDASAPAASDMYDFKELLGAQPGVTSAGKDIEFWITNSRYNALDAHGAPDPRAGQTRTFSDISNDNSTWLNMSATAFASQNITTQFHALDRLLLTDPPAYRRVIDMLRSSEPALAQMKQGVREGFTIYSDQEIQSAIRDGAAHPTPGTRVRR